jgi:CRISPR/Cas system-associated exonuclease Cas4 (RecB family)
MNLFQLEKNELVLAKLNQFKSGNTRHLSASSINTYINCPLLFYFSVIEQLNEEDTVSENIESSVFGSIFHHVMELIYQEFQGRSLDNHIIQKIIKNDDYLTKIIQISFAKNYFNTPDPQVLTGQNYLIGEVIRRYVKQLLRVDTKLTPFTYVESEKKIEMDYFVSPSLCVSLKGYIDRIDNVDNKTRIIDYKTGKGELGFKTLEELFNKNNKKRPKHILQVFLYTHLLMLENPEKTIIPGIYFLRSIFEEDFSYQITHDKVPITDFLAYQDSFKVLLNQCLSDIFDPSIPFSQTPLDESCKWCQFASLCKK